MAYNNVAIAGASGNIGTAITKALIDSKQFNVTILSRSGSAAKPSIHGDASTVEVDYTNHDNLTAALKGQDAVISVLSHAGLAHQRALLDASVSAGVHRFIPSEFGSDSLNPKAATLPIFAPKKEQEKYLRQLAAEGKISWTIVISGPALDFCMRMRFLGPDLKKRKITWLDDGVGKFSTSILATIGQAVVGVLKKPEETNNRAVYVQSTALTLRDMFRLSKLSLGEEGWTEVDGGKTEENERLSYEKLGNGQKDMGVMLVFLQSAIFGEGYGGNFQKLDNDLLGIEELKESDIIELMKKIDRELSL
ncbi:MAG: hypothetical protein M1820_002365 [Bogoriella megaspora]|nr:MAG: hypothetical protein M1820_002365 [Bogoriella megaspora]